MFLIHLFQGHLKGPWNIHIGGCNNELHPWGVWLPHPLFGWNATTHNVTGLGEEGRWDPLFSTLSWVLMWVGRLTGFPRCQGWLSSLFAVVQSRGWWWLLVSGEFLQADPIKFLELICLANSWEEEKDNWNGFWDRGLGKTHSRVLSKGRVRTV